MRTEYKKDSVNGGDLIVLTGNVEIDVTDDSNVTKIFAEKITYNRTSEILFAEGSVTLKNSSNAGDGGDDITAQSLIFNTATREGVFDDGRIVQSQSSALNLPNGSTLVISSDVFGRAGGVLAFKNGDLTFCDDENPHWKIKASRIWLLPGGEFAFLNALIYVGKIPIFYLPAFYYPKDELLFNPAFGYDARRGFFFNTTTYFYGRKPLDAKTPLTMQESSSSNSDLDLYSFMKASSLKEQVREGLVLHNTDRDYTGQTTDYVKFLGDYYAKLGGLVGVDANYTSGKIFSVLQGTIQLGFSKTLFREQKNGAYIYTPHAASNGDFFRDSSELMSVKLPFRYMWNLKLGISRPFSLNLSMPTFSDPYFTDDFFVRAESMDWIGFLMSSKSPDTKERTISEHSSFAWEMNASYSPKLPDGFSPYISSLSISSLSSSILFSSIARGTTLEDGWSKEEIAAKLPQFSPQRKFFFPSQITPVKISTRISGTIFQYPIPKKSKNYTSPKNILNVPFELQSEEEREKFLESQKSKELENFENENPEQEKSEDEKIKNQESANENPNENPQEDEPIFSEDALVQMNVPSFSSSQIGGIKYSLTYSIAPEYVTQISYSSSNLKTPSDFDWHNMQSTYQQVRAPTTATSTINYRDNFLSLTDTFSFNPIFQSHPYLNEEFYTTKSSQDSVKTSDFSARKLDLTNTNAFSFRPFAYTEHFAETGITWNTTLKLIETKYIGTDPNEPEWEYLTADLTDDERFTVHNLNFIFGAKERDFTQKLTLTTTLPPQVDNYSGVLSLGTPHTSFSISSGIKQKSKDDDTWQKQNLSQSFSLRLFSSKLSLTQNFVYNLEEKYAESLRFSISGYGLQLAYTSSYTTSYYFEKDSINPKKGSWKTNNEKKFQPYSLSLAYVLPSKTFKRFNEKLSFTPSLSTSLVYDFVRPTNSYFIFKPAFTLKISDALEMTFSTETRNSSIFRYMSKLTKTDIPVGGETNIFRDLINSFRFDNEDLRQQSGFKLRSFNVKITHSLHDWDLSAEFSMKPRLIQDGDNSAYDYSPFIALTVLWKPLEGIKTKVVDEYGTWKLNPSSTSSD